MVVAVLVVVAIVGVVAAVVFRFYVYRKKSEEPFQFGGHTGERRLWRVGRGEVGANWTKYGCLLWGVLSVLMVAGAVVAILTGLWPTDEGP